MLKNKEEKIGKILLGIFLSGFVVAAFMVCINDQNTAVAGPVVIDTIMVEGQIVDLSVTKSAGAKLVSIKFSSGEIVVGLYDDESFKNNYYISPDKKYRATVTVYSLSPVVSLEEI